MAEKKHQVKPTKAATPAPDVPKKKSTKTAPVAKSPLVEVENNIAKAASSKKKPAAKVIPVVELPVEQPVEVAVPTAKPKKKPAAKSEPIAASNQETAVLEQVPAKPSATKKVAAVQIDHACELALEKLRQQNAQGQYSTLVAELEWVLGSYRFDGNPIGVYQKVNVALEELLALKAQYTTKVSQKLIEQLERALKN